MAGPAWFCREVLPGMIFGVLKRDMPDPLSLTLLGTEQLLCHDNKKPCGGDLVWEI